MGGKVLELESDKLIQRGIEQGLKKGIQQGIAMERKIQSLYVARQRRRFNV